MKGLLLWNCIPICLLLFLKLFEVDGSKKDLKFRDSKWEETYLRFQEIFNLKTLGRLMWRECGIYGKRNNDNGDNDGNIIYAGFGDK